MKAKGTTQGGMHSIASRSLVISALAMLAAMPAQAVSVFTWDGANSFNRDNFITFADTTVSRLVTVRGPGKYGQLPGLPQVPALSVRSGTQWHQISTAASGAGGRIADILPSRSFDPLTINALGMNARGQFGSSPTICAFFNACYDSMKGTQFIFARPGEVVWTGSDLVNGSEILMFDPFRASGFLGASGAGTFGQLPGLPQYGRLQVRMNGQWQVIAQTAMGADGKLSDLFAPSQFAAGMIDGIALERLNRSGAVSDQPDFCTFFGGCYRNLDLQSFQFQVAGGVPEPDSWAMLIAGFGLTGAAMRRRAALARAEA